MEQVDKFNKLTNKNTKITKLFEKDIFKIVTLRKFIIFNKVFIFDKLITFEKISSNIQKYNFHHINKIKDLYIHSILKLLLLTSI